MEDAYELYLRTSRLDLDDYNKEVEEGLHITSMTGTWMSIVYGFGGLKIVEGLLSIDPKLPNSGKFHLRLTQTLTVEIDGKNCHFTWIGNNPII